MRLYVSGQQVPAWLEKVDATNGPFNGSIEFGAAVVVWKFGGHYGVRPIFPDLFGLRKALIVCHGAGQSIAITGQGDGVRLYLDPVLPPWLIGFSLGLLSATYQTYQ